MGEDLYRYKAFMDAIMPGLALLLHEKRLQGTPVLPRDAGTCPLYVMCAVSDKTLPGVGALHRALIESGESYVRMGRPLLEFETFKRAARPILTENEEDLDSFMKACRVTGSKSVALDTVMQLLCFRLKRSM